MSVIKFVEFAPQGASIYFKHLEYLAKEQGWEIEFDSYPEFNPDLLLDADIVKVDKSFSSAILVDQQVQPSEVNAIGCVDFLVKEQGKWYPRVFLFEALRKIIVEKAKNVITRYPGFVAGNDADAIIAISVLVNIGLRKIYMTGRNMNELEQRAEKLSKIFFGVEFVPFVPESIIDQGFGAGIFINAMNLKNDDELVRELCFFMYMRKFGYVIDLNLIPLNNPVLEEAERSELRVIRPIDLLVQETYFCLQELNLLGSLKVEDLSLSWEKFIMENFEAVSKF